ncbi:MAG: asparagine synthase (glutamine-hydrolyzing) [Pseudomonadota bacterium]
MCGIYGVWRPDGKVPDLAVVRTMGEALVHRGPDGEGIWSDEGVALGHRRLAIRDPGSSSAQPMVSASGNGVLSYNGELYNAEALRQALEAEGAVFETTGDTEIVLQALERWGTDALPRFDGMFALAYFDNKTRQLLLARDRMGIKPLLLMHREEDVLFASEAKAFGAIDRLKIHDVGVAQWLTEPRSPLHRLYRGCSALPPGGMVTFDGSEESHNTFFQLLDHVSVPRILSAKDKDKAIVDTVDRALRDSVDSHLVSDVPVTVFCSGGIDSSLLTAFAKDRSPDMEAYVADVGGPNSEVGRARTVADHLGVKLNTIPVTPDMFMERWREASAACDGPICDPNYIPLLLLTERCQADGYKVVLTGEGADELFVGYRWHRATWKRWRSIEGLRGLIKGSRQRRSRKATLERHPFAYMDGSKAGRHGAWASLNAQQLSDQRRILDHLETLPLASDRAVLAHALHDMEHHLGWLLHRHDSLGMANSVEVRVPFLSNGLIDLATHLPRHMKMRGSVNKWVLKQVAKRYLPPSIVQAPKIGFYVPPDHAHSSEAVLKGGQVMDWLRLPQRQQDAFIEALPSQPLLRFQLVSLEFWLASSKAASEEG